MWKKPVTNGIEIKPMLKPRRRAYEVASSQCALNSKLLLKELIVARECGIAGSTCRYTPIEGSVSVNSYLWSIIAPRMP